MILEHSAVCKVLTFPFVFFRDVHKQTVIVRDESLQTIFSGKKKSHLVTNLWAHSYYLVKFVNMLKFDDTWKAYANNFPSLLCNKGKSLAMLKYSRNVWDENISG